MRYRLVIAGNDDNLVLGSDRPGKEDRPLVHVFRDDELDAIRLNLIDHFGSLAADYFIDVLRNHTSERQPGSADGAG